MTKLRAVPVAAVRGAAVVDSAPAEAEERVEALDGEVAKPWVTIVWNDPVNLMSYVTYVFQTYFGHSKEKAEKLMRDVHEAGRAVVSSGTREEMERDTEAMHGYGLWATFAKDN
ncbi:ATP-dependent Clp protease adapter ClpS [Quadrisphaera granulorum]|uniref:ATP-dependent Clp protease adapter ClpS n=1 Tax=Quadrisphaera granulorum TaxID=317664 RepID=UPI000D6DB468